MTYGTNASYTYNAEGIRKSKTVNGATTTFNLVGSTILSQTKNGQTLVFLYDGNGSLIGFKDKATNKDYFYLKNLQGDIVQIIDSSGTVVVTYEYDAWEKFSVFQVISRIQSVRKTRSVTEDTTTMMNPDSII